MSGDRRTDVAVVGAGPAGLAAGLVFGRARRPAVVIDAGPGRNAPSPAVHSLLGLDGVTPAQLRALGLDELAPHPDIFVHRGTVQAIEGKADAFTITTTEGPVSSARRVVLATGVVDRLPDIDGLAPLWGRSVLHCPYCHGWEVRGRPLAVLATRSLDLLAARKLTHLSDDVAVCPHGQLDLSTDEQAMLDRAGIAAYPQPIAGVDARGDQLEAIRFADGTTLARHALFVHPTVEQAAPFARRFGCDLVDDTTSVAVDDVGQTSVPGVYAIGDMARRRTHPLPGHQVANAAAAGTTTAIWVDQQLLLTDL